MLGSQTKTSLPDFSPSTHYIQMATDIVQSQSHFLKNTVNWQAEMGNLTVLLDQVFIMFIFRNISPAKNPSNIF